MKPGDPGEQASSLEKSGPLNSTSLFSFRLFKWVFNSPLQPLTRHARGDTHAHPHTPASLLASPQLAEINRRPSLPSSAAALRQRSPLPSWKTRQHSHPPPQVRVGWEGVKAGWRGWGRRGDWSMRLILIGWRLVSDLVRNPRPHSLSSPLIPAFPLAPSYLPPHSSSSSPFPCQHRHPRGWKDCSRTRGRSKRGRRGRLELHNFTLVIVSEREAETGEGAERRSEARERERERDPWRS